MARGRPSKKQLILDTALDLFSKAGFQGTSIDLVVQKAGVSKPTVYNNFPTKQALLSELVEFLLSKAQAERQVLLENKEGLSTSALLVAAFKKMSADPAYTCLYRIFYGECHKLDQDVQEQLSQLDQDLKIWVSQLLEQRFCQPDDMLVLMLFAVCRELTLIPVLSGEQPMANEKLVARVQSAIDKLESAE
ncbi:TetR/AcrR family transcriptional regulator [Neptunomonas concharum]|uniref:TetR/AcrR family transcriptional regulator n=1 Tax=Neptunomonas concharum TaxID=1031538 RepID=A0A5P1RA15_9GAMM|nr:TetR/AcrR family transcriptional regulator [Neptunomonas concharum]QEQ96489.1 TetR/AcrR family transcriptional regulator [Neptunomonas concharum]